MVHSHLWEVSTFSICLLEGELVSAMLGGINISIHSRSNRVLLKAVKMLQLNRDIVVWILLHLTNCVLGIIVPDCIVHVALHVVIVVILRILVSCLIRNRLG